MKSVGCGMLFLALIATGWVLPGCIPSEPGKTGPTAAPETTKSGGLPVTGPASAGAEGEDQKAPAGGITNNLTFTMNDGRQADDVGVRIEKMETGGYRMKGSFGLEGTITQPAGEANRWVLQGEFSFPGAGYEVGEPFYSPLSTAVPTKDGLKLIPQNDVIIVTIPVKIPASPAPAATPVKVPMTFPMDAPKEASFTVVFASS